MTENFIKASSDNLPSVDSEMISDFFVRNVDFISAEIRGAKASRATKQHYGDSAVGFVRLFRINNECTVKARVTPEHKVHNKDYNVTVVIDETNEMIISGTCSDCAASAGGCKHVIVFIFWLHRKSEEPAPTSVTCYCKSSALSRVGRSSTYMKTTDIVDKPLPPPIPAIPNFKELVLRCGIEQGATGILFNSPSEYVTCTSLCQLALSYKKNTSAADISPQNFEAYCASKMADDICAHIEKTTTLQKKTDVWEKIRFGRITASRLYETARCKTASGSLTDLIMGAALPLKLDAVLRGQQLEDEELGVVGARMDLSYKKCGIFIDKSYPLFGASPDDINEDYIFEVKCTSKASTVKNYLKDGTVTAKPFCQMQLQMLLAKQKQRTFLCGFTKL